MGEEMLTMEECLQMAAQAWCEPTTSHLVMEGDLARAFAQILYDFANRTIEEPMPPPAQARGDHVADDWSEPAQARGEGCAECGGQGDIWVDRITEYRPCPSCGGTGKARGEKP